ncbi:hypothetical protein BC830DRAFT_617237 [Chytriomyces sp. MP71]|nr:hypothetical protein BC830DRAFT_617237 [Chytriomyces sp. MP71]
MRSSLPPSSKRTSASEIVALYNRPVPRPLLSQQPLVNLKESLNPSHETKRLMPTRAETPQSREVSPTPPSSSIAPDEISESDSTFSVANKGVWSKDADALKSVRNRNDGRNGDKEVPGSRKEDDFLDGRVNASKGKHIAHSTAVATSSRTLGSTRPGFETHISGTPIEKSIVRGGRIDNVSSSVESRTVPDIHIERPHNSSRNHHGARQTDEITYAPGASPNTIITEDEDPSLYAIHSRTASAASSNISKTSSARSKRREKLADAQKARGTAIPIAIVPVSLMPEKTEQENVLKGRDDARPQNTSSCEITSVPEILTTASSSKGTRRTSPFSTARLKRRSKQASSSSDLNRWLKRKSASSDSQNDGIEPVELLKPAHLQTDQSEHIESALPQHQESTVNSLPPMPECERRHDTSSTQCVSSLVMSDNTAFTSSQNVEALLKSSARNVTDPIKGKAPAQKEVNGEREELPAGVPKLSSPRGLSLPRKKQLNRINASFNANQTSTPASLQAPAHFVNQPPRALLSPVSNGPDENSPEIDEYNGEDFEVVEVPSELPEYLSSESLDFVEEFLEDGQRQTRFDTNSEASFQEYDFEDHLDGNLSKTSQPNTTSSNYFETADYDDFDPNTFPLQVVQNDVSYEYEIDAPTDPLKDPDGPILNKPKHPWRPSSYQSGFMYHEHKPPIPYTSEYPHVTQDSKLHAKTPFATPVAKKLHQSHSLKMYSKQIQSHFGNASMKIFGAAPSDIYNRREVNNRTHRLSFRLCSF